MRITKSQLKRIIKEEIVSLVEINGRGRSSQIAQDIAAHRASQGKGPRNSPNRDEDLARARGESSYDTDVDNDQDTDLSDIKAVVAAARETGDEDPQLEDIDLINEAKNRMRRQIEEFIYNNPKDRLKPAQVKALFLKALLGMGK
jgi:chorismate mutase